MAHYGHIPPSPVKFTSAWRYAPLNRKGLQILYLQPCHVANAGGRASRAKPDPRAATHRPRRLAALVEHGEHGEDFGRSLYPLRGVGGSAPSLSKNIVPRFARLFSVCARGAGGIAHAHQKQRGVPCSLRLFLPQGIAYRLMPSSGGSSPCSGRRRPCAWLWCRLRRT